MSESSSADQQTRGVSYLYMAAAFVIVVAGMRAAEQLLNPLLLAVFLSIISAPAYFRLIRNGVSEWLALLTVIGVLSVVLFGIVFVVTSSIAGFTTQQQHYLDRLDEEQKKLKLLTEAWLPDWLDKEDGPPLIEPTSELPPSVAGVDESPAATGPAADLRSESEVVTADKDTVAGREVEPTTEDSAANSVPDDEGDVTPENSENGPIVLTDDLANGIQSQPSGSTIWKMADQSMPETQQSWTEEIFGQFDLGTLLRLATTVVQSLGLLLSKAFLVLLMVIFILLEAPRFTRKISDAFVRTEDTTERASQIIESVQHYIVIKTWVSLATGLLIAIWLRFLGVSHAPLWGLLAFLFNYIPNVGSILAAIPAVLIAWLELTWLPAVACVIGFVAVNGVIGNFVEPRMMGKSLGLSPLVVFCSMLFWGWVLGPIGMLLSVPLTMTARIAMEGFEDTKWLATLMGNS